MRAKIIFFSAVFSFLAAFLNAEPVTNFNFSGLKKTKTSYLEKVLSRFYGREADEALIHEIETALYTEGLFEEIKVTQETEGAGEINISLKEKITFIPVPFLMTTNDSWTAGGVVINMNAFGNKSMLMAGCVFSSNFLSGIFALSKPAASKEDLGWSVSTSVNRSSAERNDIYGEPYTEYKSTGFSLGGSLSRKVTDFTSVTAGLSGDCTWFSEKEPYPLPFEDDTSFRVKASAGFSHGTTDWNGWFLNSKTLSAGAEAGWDFSVKEDFYKAHGSITFQQAIIPRLRINAASSGSYCRNVHFNSWSGGGSASVAILPTSFVSPSLAGATAGLELALKKVKFGLFSLYANYQAVYTQMADEEYKFCQGATGGVRLYLSKIAFPAFAMGFGKNITTNNWVYSASLGVSF